MITEHMITELFLCVWKDPFTTSNKAKDSDERVTDEEGLHVEGLQQAASHWLHSGAASPEKTCKRA